MMRLFSSLLPKVFIACVALALAAIIGAFEYATGYDFHLTALFLVPICLAAWKIGRKGGLCLAVICAIAWLVTDLATGHPYKYRGIPYWNALMLLAFFVVVVQLLCGFQDAHRKLRDAQSQLQNQNDRLEETVRQRTASLEAEIEERKRLEKANLQAERLAMAGTIAAQVAHEVRNPLGSITLNLDLAAREIQKLAACCGESADEGRELVKEMREEIRRIQHVLEEYLKLARLPKPRPQQLGLNSFVQDKLDFMRSAFEQAGVRVRTEFDASVKAIKADPEQLWQALLNLVQNSLEAMPRGGSLTVSTRREDGQALLRVTDAGNGMNEEQLKQVFVPFFTCKPRGTGLGLSITQRILNEHGAQVECSSALGKGTTFTIHFPLSEQS